ncbi:ABC transporter permease [Paenibacillus eucommiae]|uniref:Aldouronate transport system permease protein n=1 Tax=Paenibacillus eucommiae TaxID=1355755 RepID=A0ABS4IS09_9BACL|nr:ABC transporter permease subunit [Paenibacillus eucommiae]MBP1990313.1 putative aldouronate transport system permease protein [Paenibacillus eucommiae]
MNKQSDARHYHLMLLPGMLLVFIFSIIPMFGIVIAFQDFNPGLGFLKSSWIGLSNFRYMFELPDSKTIFYNTLFISSMKIIANLIVPLLFALMLNELRLSLLKRWVQTIVYLPHFLSWVILSGSIVEILSLNGPVNQVVQWFANEPILFLGSNQWFPPIIIFSDVWKEFGFGTIIYLAALTGISPALYEAARMDGATRIQQLMYITLPGITTTVVLLATLSLGNVLNAGFDQIFNLYNPLVYESGDIIDTYVYRIGLINTQFGFATAVGLMKSVISFVLIVVSYRLAFKLTNYRIF